MVFLWLRKVVLYSKVINKTRSSNNWRSSVKKLFIKVLQYPQEYICVGVYFLIKLLTLLTLLTKFIKERLQHRCFPVHIAKFLRNLFWRLSGNGCFCKTQTTKIKKIPPTVFKKVISQVISQNLCKIGINPKELEFLE